MVRLSIITVAKGRYDTFKKSCDSIWNLAQNPHEVEHIVMYDYDDDEMAKFLEEYAIEHIDRKISYHPVEYSKTELNNIHKSYWNPAARLSDGEVVFGLPNDAVILTDNYDSIILDAVDKFKETNKHGIVQVLVDDDSDPPNPFCSWVILSREAVKIINGIVPDVISFCGGDQVVNYIFTRCVKPVQINLRDVIKTEHVSHYTGKAEVDDVTLKREEKFKKDTSFSWSDFQKYINQINYKILSQ